MSTPAPHEAWAVLGHGLFKCCPKACEKQERKLEKDCCLLSPLSCQQSQCIRCLCQTCQDRNMPCYDSPITASPASPAYADAAYIDHISTCKCSIVKYSASWQYACLMSEPFYHHCMTSTGVHLDERSKVISCRAGKQQVTSSN